MRTILNIIWLVLSGLWLAIGYAFAGVVMCILIITIPFGIQAFKLAGCVRLRRPPVRCRASRRVPRVDSPSSWFPSIRDAPPECCRANGCPTRVCVSQARPCRGCNASKVHDATSGWMPALTYRCRCAPARRGCVSRSSLRTHTLSARRHAPARAARSVASSAGTRSSAGNGLIAA
jgi:inner membrane component-like transport protein